MCASHHARAFYLVTLPKVVHIFNNILYLFKVLTITIYNAFSAFTRYTYKG